MAASFKDIQIAIDIIPVRLKEFTGNAPEVVRKGGPYHFTFEKDGKPGKIIVHPKNKGLVTLDYSSGDRELAKAACEYIIENSVIAKMKAFRLKLSGYNDGKLKTLIEYLTEECGAELDGEPRAISHGMQHKIKGKQGDIVTLDLYKNGTLYIQGRPVVLVAELVEYLAQDDATSSKELFEHLETIYGTTATVDGAKEEVGKKYPSAAQYGGDQLNKLIETAVGMHSLSQELTDYSPICFPALRALEGFMRLAVVKKINKNLKNFGETFDEVSKTPLKVKVKEDVEKELCCENTCKMLEECYCCLKTNRHTLLHASGLDFEIRTIATKEEAIAISETALELINSHSQILLEANEKLSCQKAS